MEEKKREVLNAVELAEYLHISRAKAYTLLHSQDFPTLRIGKRLLVKKEDLLKWMATHTNHLL